MITQCKICGKDFEARPNRVISGAAKCCSRACMGLMQRQLATFPCSYCDTPISRHPSRFGGGFVYCDSVCRNKHKADLRRPDVRFDGEFVFIPLTKDQWAKVDLADYDSIPMLREHWTAYWSKTGKTFYASRMEGERLAWMHRVITGAEEGQEVNHRNYDGLDNTRANIEACTRAENQQYRRRTSRHEGSGPMSRFKGVFFCRKKWVARINVSGKLKHLGTYEREEEAAEAYNRAAASAYGRFAHQNIVTLSSEDSGELECPV